MALLPLLALYTTKTLDLTLTGNALVIPLGGTKRILLSLSRLSGSGATLVVHGSTDGGSSYEFGPLLVIDFEAIARRGSITDDGEYLILTRTFTHLRVRPSIAGNGVAILAPTPATPTVNMDWMIGLATIP